MANQQPLQIGKKDTYAICTHVDTHLCCHHYRKIGSFVSWSEPMKNIAISVLAEI
jgi:hypothetical protein